MLKLAAGRSLVAGVDAMTEPMVGDANIRASDADRDRVATALRENLAVGRLTIEEFDERLDRAFAAKTLGDLDSLMADLPVDLERPGEGGSPAKRSLPGLVEDVPGSHVPAWRGVGRPWLGIALFFFLLWLFSGAAGGPWFLWPALFAGVFLLARHARRDGRRDSRHSGR